MNVQLRLEMHLYKKKLMSCFGFNPGILAYNRLQEILYGQNSYVSMVAVAQGKRY
jgi:hypothetical protein